MTAQRRALLPQALLPRMACSATQVKQVVESVRARPQRKHHQQWHKGYGI